jgi:hypothetical protein
VLWRLWEVCNTTVSWHHPPFIASRNGGHVNPQLYSEYGKLKKDYGKEMAKKMIRFRLSHLPELKRVSEEEGILEDTQCREVEHCDVYYDRKLFESTKKKIEVYRKDMPEEAAEVQIYESKEGIEVGLVSLAAWMSSEFIYRDFILHQIRLAAWRTPVAQSTLIVW